MYVSRSARRCWPRVRARRTTSRWGRGSAEPQAPVRAIHRVIARRGFVAFELRLPGLPLPTADAPWLCPAAAALSETSQHVLSAVAMARRTMAAGQ